MPSYEKVKPEYAKLYESCIPNPRNVKTLNQLVNKIVCGKARYTEVCDPLGIPWLFVGIIHMLESNCDFTTHLHNGDSLNTRTVHVPPGRPRTGTPPFTWEESAKDALAYEGFTSTQSWSLTAMLYKWEKYNGWGYRNETINIPSPYLWAMSNHYTAGKFLEERINGKYKGVFHPEVISKQCGAAVLLKHMELSKIITLKKE